MGLLLVSSGVIHSKKKPIIVLAPMKNLKTGANDTRKTRCEVKGFIVVETVGGTKITIAVEYIAMIFDGKPCYIQVKSDEHWPIKQTYEEINQLIKEAQKEGEQ